MFANGSKSLSKLSFKLFDKNTAFYLRIKLKTIIRDTSMGLLRLGFGLESGCRRNSFSLINGFPLRTTFHYQIIADLVLKGPQNS